MTNPIDRIQGICFSAETWGYIRDLVEIRQFSLERDIVRAENSGSLDYEQILIDEATNCKDIVSMIDLVVSLEPFNY